MEILKEVKSNSSIAASKQAIPVNIELGIDRPSTTPSISNSNKMVVSNAYNATNTLNIP